MNTDQSPQKTDQSPKIDLGYYYHPMSIIKFSIMSFCTGGLYLIFWFYKCFKYIKTRDNDNSWPLVSAIISTIVYFLLIKDVNISLRQNNYNKIKYIPVLAILFFICNALWKLPDPFWLASSLSFLFIIPTLTKINLLNYNSEQLIINSKYGIKSYTILAISIPILLFTLLTSFNILPSTHVIHGSKLSKSNTNLIKEYGMIEDGEKILYFYSGSIFNIEGDGNFFTDKKIVSYEKDYETGDLIGGSAYYNEVSDIKIEYSHSLFEDTTITVEKTDGSSFLLIASTEENLDKKFAKELLSTWNKRKKLTNQ